jgi:hypothetical protein
MEHGHKFPKEHGFTGSANTSKEHRPSIPGFPRGQNMPDAGTEPTGSIDQMDGPAAMPVAQMKQGGRAHKKNYAHGGRIEHDDHPKHDSHSSYDKHGFHIHNMKKGGCV